jgi:hypothetical protein
MRLVDRQPMLDRVAISRFTQQVIDQRFIRWRGEVRFDSVWLRHLSCVMNLLKAHKSNKNPTINASLPFVIQRFS